MNCLDPLILHFSIEGFLVETFLRFPSNKDSSLPVMLVSHGLFHNKFLRLLMCWLIKLRYSCSHTGSTMPNPILCENVDTTHPRSCSIRSVTQQLDHKCPGCVEEEEKMETENDEGNSRGAADRQGGGVQCARRRRNRGTVAPLTCSPQEQ